MTRAPHRALSVVLAVALTALLGGCAASTIERPDVGYPWHTNIPATTFWVGEVFDPSAADGSQRISAYDTDWLASYGGCDGIVVPITEGTICSTERRTADSNYFPTAMTPHENPFYLDLPFDDVNDDRAFSLRGSVVPWAGTAPYDAIVADRSKSLMKNRWVVLHHDGRLCYGQIQDAGPGVYDDAPYVFGADDARPANARFNGAGLDVSPALNGCLGFAELDGDGDHVDWAFVDEANVPAGPWTRIVTTSPVQR